MGILSPKCQSCGIKSDEVVEHRTGKKLCPSCVEKTDNYLAKVSKIILSTGDIDRSYDIVQVIMNIGAGVDGWDSVFSRTIYGLKNDAVNLKCDAIINIKMEHRIFVKSEQTLFSGERSTQGIEFFAYGTAVRFK